ncbi:MAG TPA: HD domain-containing protein [Solirubrobacteraceae bacterium]
MPIRIRDPIHNFIELRDEERAAIDSAVFQRLRSIRQLAMTHLVYPGALHTRFEHSVGVCHLAGRVVSELQQKAGIDTVSDADIATVRTAALLHDIGHGPFSHVSEGVLDLRNNVRGVHEAISVEIMRTDAQLQAAFGSELCQRAADLVGHEGDFKVRTALRDIVSGPSDADKLDYLQRDSYFAGVQYGKYDLGRLIDTVTVINAGGVENYLGFKEDGLWAVEGLLLARHHMHRQVYGHKTRIATDILVERALTYGLDDGAVDSAAFEVPIVDNKPAPDEAFLTAYLKQTDASVMQALLAQADDTPSRQLARRLAERDLLRRNARINLTDERRDLGGPRIAQILDRELMAAKSTELEEKIASELSCPAYLVALRVEDQANPVYRNPSAGFTDKDILLSFPDRQPETIHEISEIFRDELGKESKYVSLFSPRNEDLTDDKARDLLWNALMTI